MSKNEGNNDNELFCNQFNVGCLDQVIQDEKTPKSVKQAALARIRELEKLAGKEFYGNYNGGSRNPSEMARFDEETMGDMS